jgi:glycosyltransferase involved in cell wall biosynthesis
MTKVLGIINGLGTGGAEKLILESAVLINEKIPVDFLFLESKNYPFEKQFKTIFKSNYFFSNHKSVYNPLHIFSIAKRLKNYNVVHVHLFPAFYWVVLAKLISFSSIKIVYTEHSTSNRRMRNKFFKWIDLFIYSKIDKIITISEEVDGHLKKYLNSSQDQLMLIKNGVNIKKIFDAQPLSKSELHAGMDALKKTILQVSSFHHPKDQYTVIKSLLHLPNNIIAVFVGDGVDKGKVEKFVNKNNLTDRVLFLGIRTDVPQLLKTADIVILSSHYEGLSLSSIEGMASGKPFIASDVPGLQEVVKDAGLLFEDKNEKQLALHIKRLLEDQNYREKIAQACQERAKLYDIQKMVDQQVELYKSLCQ